MQSVLSFSLCLTMSLDMIAAVCFFLIKGRLGSCDSLLHVDDHSQGCSGVLHVGCWTMPRVYHNSLPCCASTAYAYKKTAFLSFEVSACRRAYLRQINARIPSPAREQLQPSCSTPQNKENDSLFARKTLLKIHTLFGCLLGRTPTLPPYPQRKPSCGRLDGSAQ